MTHTLEDLKSGNLIGIKKLILSDNLTKFPLEILTLADSLEILDLSNNKLSELPKEILQLKKLRIIFFENNKFTAFPKILAELPLLTMIGFKTNQIQTIPENAFPPLLRWLVLTNNKINKLPKSIGRCTLLQKFAIAGNKLEELPVEMSNCINLELFRVSANKLKKIPNWLFSLPKLSWIAFGGNPAIKPIEANIEAYDWSDFKLKEVLGQGASGVISKANWVSKNEDIAVKIFKGSVTSDGLPEDELKVSIAAGKHQNLIPILGRIKNHPKSKDGLLMQLISKDFLNLGNPPSLETCTRDVFCNETLFGIQNVLKIAKSIASVSKHLHSKGINHGDLYAHNILVNTKYETIFGDFGAATFYNKNSEFAYGKKPNDFFSKSIEELEPKSILMPADGEGRNGVFAAKLGWDVTSTDLSNEGRNKALQLAKENSVSINYLVGDIQDLNFPKNSFDAIGLVYAHFAASKITSIHQILAQYLKPKGTIILEAYSKSHLKSFYGEATPVHIKGTANEFDELVMDHTTGSSISGVQRKMFMHLDKGVLMPSYNGEYIVKPTPRAFPSLSENEHAVMKLCEAVGLKTAQCSVVRFEDGEFAYITKRFDLIQCFVNIF